jgi:adenylylsulfate kinase-like enzyme
MRRNPWIGLILVAGTLAAAAHFLLPRPRELLVIDREALEFRLGVRVRATGIPPSEQERREIEERLIQEELLLREAARRGQLVQKNLYKHASEGALEGGLPGISAPYEEPENPEVLVESDLVSPHESAKRILDYVMSRWRGEV